MVLERKNIFFKKLICLFTAENGYTLYVKRNKQRSSRGLGNRRNQENKAPKTLVQGTTDKSLNISVWHFCWHFKYVSKKTPKTCSHCL